MLVTYSLEIYNSFFNGKVSGGGSGKRDIFDRTIFIIDLTEVLILKNKLNFKSLLT